MSGYHSYDGWAAFGTGTLQTPLPVALTTTRAIVNFRVPAQCRISSIEARVNSIAGGAANLTLALFRDSTANDVLVGASAQALTTGTGTATDGGAAWAVNRDHHPDGSASSVASRAGWPNEQYVNLYATLATDAGTANLDGFVVNWQG